MKYAHAQWCRNPLRRGRQSRGGRNGRPFEHTYPRSPSRWRTRPRPRSPCPRRMPSNRNSSTASGSPPRASTASRIPPACCANPDRRLGRPRRRRDRSSRPPGTARPRRRRGRLLFSQQGWMDGWIYRYTDKRVRYDIRSSGGVTPDDERTRATCSSLSRHLLYLLLTVRDRRLRQVQQTGIVVR